MARMLPSSQPLTFPLQSMFNCSLHIEPIREPERSFQPHSSVEGVDELSREGLCQKLQLTNPGFAVSCSMPWLNDFCLIRSSGLQPGRMEVTLPPSCVGIMELHSAHDLAALSGAMRETLQSISHIRACSRHINREVILSGPQAVEVAQHLQAAEQALHQARAVLSAQLNAIAEQLRAAQLAFLLRRQYTRCDPSDSSVVIHPSCRGPGL